MPESTIMSDQSSQSRQAVLARITGKVQGVWYRRWTVDTATALGLDGWVRNREDGSVEALFAGSAEQVSAMLEACRQGPPDARVIDVVAEPADDPGHLVFAQRSTV